MSGEDLFLGHRQPFLAVFSCGGRVRELSGISFIRTLIPFMRNDLITSERTHLKIPSHWGLGCEHMYLEGGGYIQSIALDVHHITQE